MRFRDILTEGNIEGRKWESSGIFKTTAQAAKELHVSRVHIKNVTQHIMKKIFREVKKENPKMSELELFLTLAKIFNAKTEEEYKEMYIGLPNDIRDKVLGGLVDKYPNLAKDLKTIKDEDDTDE